MLLFALKRNLSNSDTGRLRDVLRKFQVNRDKLGLIRKFQLKLLRTVAGQVEVSFLKWKGLPDNSELD